MLQRRVGGHEQILKQLLKEALSQRGDRPSRLPAEMLQRLAHEELQDVGIDATQRRINRPRDDELPSPIL